MKMSEGQGGSEVPDEVETVCEHREEGVRGVGGRAIGRSDERHKPNSWSDHLAVVWRGIALSFAMFCGGEEQVGSTEHVGGKWRDNGEIVGGVEIVCWRAKNEIAGLSDGIVEESDGGLGVDLETC